MTAFRIRVAAGPHERLQCPVEFPAPPSASGGRYRLSTGGAANSALEVDADGMARFICPSLAPGDVIEMEARPDNESWPATVTANDGDDGLALHVGGSLVTRYVYRDVPARPYFYPVHAEGGLAVTRAYPMQDLGDRETRDHVHHRSLWIAYGDVNGADNWSEEPGHACTKHLSMTSIRSGVVSAGFESLSHWTRADGETLLSQQLAVTLWATGSPYRILDFEIRLTAENGSVHFGDTKEGGILSVRVATEMDVTRTGRILNSYGAIDEAETWGKAAHWCDYSGIVDGKPVGVALFDHPYSFRYPTHWHVRNYGLMTANPFGYAAYTGGIKNGSHTLAKGETLTFRYRLLLHAESGADAKVRDRYLDFASPPVITVA